MIMSISKKLIKSKRKISIKSKLFAKLYGKICEAISHMETSDVKWCLPFGNRRVDESLEEQFLYLT